MCAFGPLWVGLAVRGACEVCPCDPCVRVSRVSHGSLSRSRLAGPSPRRGSDAARCGTRIGRHGPVGPRPSRSRRFAASAVRGPDARWHSNVECAMWGLPPPPRSALFLALFPEAGRAAPAAECWGRRTRARHKSNLTLRKRERIPARLHALSFDYLIPPSDLSPPRGSPRHPTKAAQWRSLRVSPAAPPGVFLPVCVPAPPGVLSFYRMS